LILPADFWVSANHSGWSQGLLTVFYFYSSLFQFETFARFDSGQFPSHLFRIASFADSFSFDLTDFALSAMK
jgi:hypothetical protein